MGEKPTKFGDIDFEKGIVEALKLSEEDGLFPGQRQTHIMRAQLYALLLLAQGMRRKREGEEAERE